MGDPLSDITAARPRPDGAVDARLALDDALRRGPTGDVQAWLQSVAEEIPVSIGTDFSHVRLLSEGGLLYLVAASGCSVLEIRRRPYIPYESVRRMVATGAHRDIARSVGISWISVAWMLDGSDTVGTVAVGSRTKRRPNEDDLRLLDQVAQRLGEYVQRQPLDRTDATLESYAQQLARTYAPIAWPTEDEPVARLRARERAVLELYADNLTTQEIADLLVLSHHTVRTHVRNALQRLGVHTREEAAAMVRAEQLAELV